MLRRSDTIKACDSVGRCVDLVQDLATPSEVQPPAVLPSPGGPLDMKTLRSYPSYNWFRICILTSFPDQRSDPLISTFSLGSVPSALVCWACTESVVAGNLSSIPMREACHACFLNLPEQTLLASARQRVEVRIINVGEPKNCFSAGCLGGR